MLDAPQVIRMEVAVPNLVHRAGWVLAGIVSLVALAAVAGIVHGGPLDPPQAPGSTSGVLRPGTPITSLPFPITQSGNYYLTHDLTMATSGDGITISANDVTIDLAGFTIDGGNVGGSGIVSTNNSGLAVRNGNAEHWKNAGFNLQFSLGAVAEQLTASFNDVGISINTATLTGCTVFENKTTGLRSSFSTISDCNAQANGTGFQLFEASISHCVSEGNAGNGISVERGSVEDCTLSANGGDGITIAVSSGGALSTVRNNTIEFSNANGITVNSGGAIVENNTLRGNKGSGIYVPGNDNRIRANTSSSNTGEGIDILGSYNTVDDNSALQNVDYGIFVALGTKNTVVKNSATGNRASSDQQNYLIASGQNAGPIGAAASATLPWSNTQ
jgi:parallel beta-helix repeat protein